MRKYNYFDDDDEIKQRKKINIPKIDFGVILFVISSLAKGIAQLIKSKRSASVTNIENVDNDNMVDKSISVPRPSFNDILSKIKTGLLPKLNVVFLKFSAFIFFIIVIFVFVLVFNHSIESQNTKNKQYYADAGSVCTECINKYGTPKIENLKSEDYGKDMTCITGLCYARQMDFDSDGNDELMLCYRNKSVYTLEIWSYVDKQFTKIYSDEANKTNDIKDGNWIAFYYHNNNYYICKSAVDTPEKVSLLQLRKGEFKESASCDYDYKNNIYSINGKICANDFETIKLSVIKASKAERIVDTALENISGFDTVSVSTLNKQKTDAQLKAEAYSQIIEKRIEQYGESKLISDESSAYIDGVALAKLIDFNGDENDELLLVYRKMIKKRLENAYNNEYIVTEEPSYYIEVYSWNGLTANKIFSRDSISNYMLDNSTNYIILKKNEKSVQICCNSYDYTNEYNYLASSKIFTYDGNGFDSTFSAKQECSYGYKNYYLDNEYTYRSTFENEAYKVPKFLNDNGEFDNQVYSFIYVSGNNKDGLQNTVNETIKTISELNAG